MLGAVPAGLGLGERQRGPDTACRRTALISHMYSDSLPLIEAGPATELVTRSNLVNRTLDRLRNVASSVKYDFEVTNEISFLRGDFMAGTRRTV